MKYVLCHTTHHVFFFCSTSIFQTEIHYTHCCALFYYRVEAHRSPESLRKGKTGLEVFACSFPTFLFLLDCYFLVMSSAQVKHEVLFLFTNRLLLRQALHSSRTFSRCRPRARPLLSLHWICIFLCQVFNVSQKLYHSPGRDVWSIKRLKRHGFLRTPSISHPCRVFFPSVGDMRAAANKLFCQPSEEPQWTSVKDCKRSLSVFS